MRGYTRRVLPTMNFPTGGVVRGRSMPRLAGGIVVARACARVAPAQRAVGADVSLLNQFAPSKPWQPSSLFGLAGQLDNRWSRLSAVQAIEASTGTVGFGDGELSGSRRCPVTQLAHLDGDGTCAERRHVRHGDSE